MALTPIELEIRFVHHFLNGDAVMIGRNPHGDGDGHPDLVAVVDRVLRDVFSDSLSRGDGLPLIGFDDDAEFLAAPPKNEVIFLTPVISVCAANFNTSSPQSWP